MHDMKQRSRSDVLLSWGWESALVAGCETNPYTGRSQLLMTSVSQEMQMGAQAYDQVKSDPKMQAVARSARDRTGQARGGPHRRSGQAFEVCRDGEQFQWEVTVIKDDKTANAFALPGGKMAVYTGIFPMAKTEAGLAAVMGHEVVHALARHGAERMSQGQADECRTSGRWRGGRGGRRRRDVGPSGDGGAWCGGASRCVASLQPKA